MKLMLDHTQRLNLHAMMGAQRGSVDEVRMWWRLQDRFALSEEELKRINYRLGKVGDVEQPMWTVDKDSSPREFECSEEELRRIERVVKEWPGFFAENDRRWLEPLLAQFTPGEVRVNGAAEATVSTGYRA